GYTNKCNMNCKHCYSKQFRELNPELKKQRLQKSLSFIEDNHQYISAINYGTGENTLLDEWYILLDRIYEIDPVILQGVTTNGFLGVQMEKSAEKREIVLKTINDVDVSLDFADRDLHNNMRRNPHAYDWVIKTLEVCKEYDISRTVVMVATPETFKKDNLRRLIETAEKYDANLRINIYRPVGFVREDFIISQRDFFNGIRYITEVLGWKILANSDPLFSALAGEKKYHGDFTGNSSIRILHDGSMTPSTYLITGDWIYCNIFYGTCDRLDKLSFNSLFKRYNKGELPELCKKCEFKEYCRGGAFDRRYLWYKTFEKPDPYCPFHGEQPVKYNPFAELSKYKSKKNIELVHDGYLPTLILSRD
ncbi:MAG: radical SAM protein, partial [Candidatus Odinarchaeota archaeon]|nr:radical SAM protein [Candidatus Odinarchaeota archaeon]